MSHAQFTWSNLFLLLKYLCKVFPFAFLHLPKALPSVHPCYKKVPPILPSGNTHFCGQTYFSRWNDRFKMLFFHDRAAFLEYLFKNMFWIIADVQNSQFSDCPNPSAPSLHVSPNPNSLFLVWGYGLLFC